MKMLYFGTLEWGSTCLQRLEGLRASVPDIYAVDQRILIGEYLTRSPWQRLQMRLGHGPLIARVSEALVMEVQRYHPDLVWVDQGLCVSADALRRIKGATSAFCVHYTPDPLISPGLRNACFKKAIPLYDLCITTKAHEVDLYYEKGAQRVLLSYKGYNPKILKPYDLDAGDRALYSCDVAFAGDWSETRARSLCFLVDQVPCRFHLYGRKWDKGKGGAKLAPYFKGWAYGQAYAKALCGAKICLAFLSTWVGDTYSDRSVEIPACGGFMLAQRTATHQELFQEDVEAVFFDGDEEMIDKVRFYLRHEEARQRIARAGYEKVKRSFPGWEVEMRKCVTAIDGQRTGGTLEL
jgi:hypothetical protein